MRVRKTVAFAASAVLALALTACGECCPDRDRDDDRDDGSLERLLQALPEELQTVVGPDRFDHVLGEDTLFVEFLDGPDHDGGDDHDEDDRVDAVARPSSRTGGVEEDLAHRALAPRRSSTAAIAEIAHTIST